MFFKINFVKFIFLKMGFKIKVFINNLSFHV